MLNSLKEKILLSGGFVNSHAHFDRAYTAHNFSSEERKMHLHEKWRLNDKFKKSASVDCYRRNIENAVQQQIKFGVTSACTFIDIDSITQGAAITAAKFVKEEYKHEFELKIACQTIKGILSDNQRYVLDLWLPELDVIGSLPAADADIEKHLDVVMGWAKKYNKRLHVHVDQLNSQKEKETELQTI